VEWLLLKVLNMCGKSAVCTESRAIEQSWKTGAIRFDNDLCGLCVQRFWLKMVTTGITDCFQALCSQSPSLCNSLFPGNQAGIQIKGFDDVISMILIDSSKKRQNLSK
jgi:hypothetical protein